MAEDPNAPIPVPGSDILPLPGSDKKVVPGAHSTGPTHPEEIVPVTLRLRARDGLKASQKDIEEVKAWAKSASLTVVSDPTHEAEERNVKVTGTVSQMQAAFGTELANYQAPPDANHPAGFNYRGRVGPVLMPRHLVTDDDGTPIIEGVFGLDDRPVARPHFRRRKQPIVGLSSHGSIVSPHAASQAFLPRQLAGLYNYPLDATGAGKIVCIISLGGLVYPGDLSAAAQAARVPPVNVTVVPIDNARPTASDADGENALDVQEIATIAYGARLYVVCAPNTDAGFLDAFTYAINILKATQVSCSWGGPESNWTSASMKAFDQVFVTGQQLGCKVFCSAGDDGSSDGTNSVAVDFPGSSPNVICCGGTRTIVNGSTLTETVWGGIPNNGATGGGFSKIFPRPAWQPAAYPMCSRPDLAGNADPETGDMVWVNGQSGAIGGTSADSPRYAALSALIDEKLGRDSGPWNPVLWAHPEVAIDITVGTNGAFNAAVGPDQTTGIGRVDGQRLLAMFAGSVVPPIVPPVVPPVIPPVQPNPPSPPGTGVPPRQFQRLLAFIQTLLVRLGPVALPYIENLLRSLPLNPAQLTTVEALIQAILSMGGGGWFPQGVEFEMPKEAYELMAHHLTTA